MTQRERRRRLLDASHLPVALYLGFVGAATILASPGHMGRAVPDWLAHTWSLTLIAGAALIVAGIATDRTRAESVGHAFHLFGLAFLGAVTAFTVDASDVAALTVLGTVSVIRMRVLARSRAARREAGEVVRKAAH